MGSASRLATVCPPSSPRFLGDVETMLRPAYEVRRFRPDETDAAEAWGDLLWAEWAIGHAATLSRRGQRPLVVRLHRYEVDRPEFREIEWRNASLLVVGSRTILERAAAVSPAIRETPALVMPAPLDFSNWPLRSEPASGYRIGAVANFDERKNPFAYLDVLRALPEQYELHLLGPWRSELYAEAFRAAAKLEFGPRVQIAPAAPNHELPAWWADKRWCLCAGLDETAGPVVAVEAAALGVWPVVYEYPAAREFWSDPGDALVLWKSPAEAAAIIREGRDRTDAAAMRAKVLRHSIEARGEELRTAVARIVEGRSR